MAKKKNTEPLKKGLSGKALKADNNLRSGKKAFKDIDSVLKTIYKMLNQVIKGRKNEKSNKDNLPQRIKFPVNEKPSINFFVDFTIAPSGGENVWDLEGNIIYGVYNKNIYDHKKQTGCSICDETIICNCSREKILLILTVNEYGLIESKDKIEDNWSLNFKKVKKGKLGEQNIKAIEEMHYRALEYIYLDALYFINEKFKNL